MFGFKNSNIYIEGLGIVKSSLKIKNGKFASFEEEKDFIELDDKYIIVPGFIDEHFHGANGSDFMSNKPEDLSNIASSIIKDGVTSFLATTMTMEEEYICNALKNIGEYKSKKNEAELLGIHQRAASRPGFSKYSWKVRYTSRKEEPAATRREMLSTTARYAPW